MSAIENVAAAVKVDVTVEPAVPVEVAVIVQVVVFVCTTAIAEIFVNVKSVPLAVDKVAQLICSLPVTVKVIDAELDVAAVLANVKVGAVVSRTVTVTDKVVVARAV